KNNSLDNLVNINKLKQNINAHITLCEQQIKTLQEQINTVVMNNRNVATVTQEQPSPTKPAADLSIDIICNRTGFAQKAKKELETAGQNVILFYTEGDK